MTTGDGNELLYIYIKEKFEHTKGIIRSHKSKKDIQHNSQKTKDKRTNMIEPHEPHLKNLG